MISFQGIFVPLVTPTDDQGHLVPSVVGDLIERLGSDVDGYFIRGTSGEYASLLDDDADTLVSEVVDVLGGSAPVVAGAGDTSTPRVMERLNRLATAGVDAVSVTTTFYFDASATELEDHFTSVADASPVPVVLYRIPQNTGLQLPVPAIARLAEHPNIVGIKDSSGDFFGFQEILAIDAEGFVVFQGREQLAMASLFAGADGVISGLANIVPGRLQQLLSAVRERDVETSRSIQRELSTLAEMFGEGHWLAVLKAAVELLGVPVGPPVPPLAPLDDAARARVRDHLHAAGLLERAGS